MRALLTGASGFIGGHLAAELLAHGYELNVLVRRGSDRSALAADRCRFFTGDLARAEIPPEALRGVDRVFHLAALINAPDADTYHRINAEGSALLYRAFASVAPPGGRFVHCSSIAAAGPSPPDVVLTESDPPRPVSPYGRSKLAAERMLSELSEHGPPLSILRPPIVYGPGGRSLLPVFKLAARGLSFTVGDPERPMTLVHVSDLGRALIQAATHPAGSGCFFITDGEIHSWRKLASAFAAAAGRSAKTLRLPDGLIRFASLMTEIASELTGKAALLPRYKADNLTVTGWACTCDAAREAFEYSPRVGLGEGLAETFESCKRAGWI